MSHVSKLRTAASVTRVYPAWSMRLRERRAAAGLTQEQAAESYGVNPRTYRGWELGEGDGRMLAGFLELAKRRAA